MLDHDRYYRDRNDLRLEERAALNYDHPDSLETDLLVQHVRTLKAGQAVEAPRYDFTRHARLTEKDTVQPRRALIVEGILIFTDPALRELMDIKVFVDTDSDTRFIRRLQRDVAERGRTMESVVDQYQSTVKPMHWSSLNRASAMRTRSCRLVTQHRRGRSSPDTRSKRGRPLTCACSRASSSRSR